MRSPEDKRPSHFVAYVALMTAVAAVLGYLEMLIPLNMFGIPGVKAGLANVVSLAALYYFGPLYAVCIMVSRVVIVGFMFGNMYSIIYGLAGGFLSLFVITLLKKTGLFTMTGVSAAGGVFHNMGQLIIALITLKGINLLYYMPVLIISGTVCGCLMGILSSMVSERLFGGRNDRFFEGKA
ncbi:MAG: Gx transporter family protein [Lachnospiraceae bacterium]|nr:Gx transporter family protein [Lachnospiraceae bacterium]